MSADVWTYGHSPWIVVVLGVGLASRQSLASVVCWLLARAALRELPEAERTSEAACNLLLAVRGRRAGRIE